MIVPILLCRKRVKVTWWDYCFPYLGAPLWFILREIGFGDAVTISNLLVEMFLVLMVSELASWIRYGLSFVQSRFWERVTFVLTFSPIATAIFVRWVMPELPA